ncbi:MAG: aspartyl/asparaginyl beta-hydroxylase domain-containing protein [Micromonosporaceae bacterium]
MSSSYMIGTVPIELARIDADLAEVEPFGFVDSYTEFVCGSWRTCMLWNATGDGADSQIRDYSGPAQMTELGRKLGYLEELMTNHFDLEKLRFARITRLAPRTVVVPHRDYVELESDLVRIHVPLMTAAEAYASEEETIYRMGLGEVWFLDATKVHSIANFSQRNRIHLLLDFHAPQPPLVFKGRQDGPWGMPATSVIPRRPLRPDEHEAFRALASVIDQANFMDVLAMIIKRYFAAAMDVREVFTWLREIAADSNDPTILSRAQWLEEHALTSR